MLPADIFAGDTPLLRHIALYGVLFPWPAPVFRNLTYLRVQLQSTPGIPAGDIVPHGSSPILLHDHLFAALARMPALRTLHLAHCIPSKYHSQNPEGHGLAVLPHLELLLLVGTLVECVGVAQHLRIPPSSRIVFECSGASQQTARDGLARFLEARVSMGTIPPLLTLSISLSAHRVLLFIELWRTRSPADAVWPKFCPDREPLISISFLPSSNSSDLVNGICEILPLEDLRVLKVAYNYNNWSPEAWINLFGRCRLVEHVLVADRNAVHFCRSLVRPATGAGGTVAAAEDLFFRHLKSLEVCNVDFLSDVEIDGHTQPFYDLLNDWLSTRANLIENDREEDSEDDSQGNGIGQISEDGRLERLRISDCSVVEDYVDRLKKYVRHVSWDGLKGIYREESA